MTTPGKLFGVGMGPGDAGYVTLRARAVVLEAGVVAHFAKKGRRGHARTIADAAIGTGRREMALVYPVTTEIAVADPGYGAAITSFYDEAAEAIARELAAGTDVAVLCEGDPFFYGSFMHLWRRLRGRFAVEVVPGVTGMSGCWSRAGVPITWGDDVLTVLPATLAKEDLVRRLGTTDAAVIMKLGRNLRKVRAALIEAGLIERAVFVERGTMDGEIVCPLAEKADDEAPYFAMVLVPGEGRRL
ncbi:precorrin-2 C(20)-methyltransferase [Chelatococcus daeguensis]|uniref:Precorrin-2 C(20)-methyltransferase n=1 Tax=Chelatococcus daeguensis TaxID=444444 RepID=A0AAC9NXJ4_9HYPH|nr:precorrin-2 C(20)-methyltransferase [Chelatococcus daeguensis]APF36352.1 precorrin-2 C(20)-methyltransferase [Chelatococcus daeguensis]